MRRSAGFTLIETLAGLLILALVVTTSLAVFFERDRRMKDAAESVIVWQALSNEAEYQRHVPFSSLLPVAEEEFQSDTALVARLDHARSFVTIKAVTPEIRRVTMTVTWGKGKHATLEILRASLPGGALF